MKVFTLSALAMAAFWQLAAEELVAQQATPRRLLAAPVLAALRRARPTL